MNEPIRSSIAEALKASYYFESLDIENFKELLKPGSYVWELIPQIALRLASFFGSTKLSSQMPREFDSWQRPIHGGGFEDILYVREGYVGNVDLCLPDRGLFIGAGTVLEPSALLKMPIYIGRNCDIRQGAYLRGYVIIADHCTVGHTTEVKNSIFMSHSEAGHFAYIGDSILGRFVNLGAGTKLANLPFRTLADKQSGAFPPVRLKIEGQQIDPGLAKIGAFLGDGVETGCNSSIAPGAFIGPDSWIYSCVSIPKGFYPGRSLIKPSGMPVIVAKQ